MELVIITLLGMVVGHVVVSLALSEKEVADDRDKLAYIAQIRYMAEKKNEVLAVKQDDSWIARTNRRAEELRSKMPEPISDEEFYQLLDEYNITKLKDRKDDAR